MIRFSLSPNPSEKAEFADNFPKNDFLRKNSQTPIQKMVF